MRVLVTGGTGYLGSAIVRALARRGHSPIVFARQSRRSATRAARRSAATSRSRAATSTRAVRHGSTRSAMPARSSASGAGGRAGLRRRQRRPARATSSTRARAQRRHAADLHVVVPGAAARRAVRAALAPTTTSARRCARWSSCARPPRRRARRHAGPGCRVRTGPGDRGQSGRPPAPRPPARPPARDRLEPTAAGRSPGSTTWRTRTSRRWSVALPGREYVARRRTTRHRCASSRSRATVTGPAAAAAPPCAASTAGCDRRRNASADGRRRRRGHPRRRRDLQETGRWTVARRWQTSGYRILPLETGSGPCSGPDLARERPREAAGFGLRNRYLQPTLEATLQASNGTHVPCGDWLSLLREPTDGPPPRKPGEPASLPPFRQKLRVFAAVQRRFAPRRRPLALTDAGRRCPTAPRRGPEPQARRIALARPPRRLTPGRQPPSNQFG